MGESSRPRRIAIADDSPAFVAAAAVGKEAFISGLTQVLAGLFPAKVAA